MNNFSIINGDSSVEISVISSPVKNCIPLSKILIAMIVIIVSIYIYNIGVVLLNLELLLGIILKQCNNFIFRLILINTIIIYNITKLFDKARLY